MTEIVLITGGGRSGKSTHALKLAEGYPERTFIATAEAFDDEMRARIAQHRAERGMDWETIEEPADLAGALKKADAPGAVVLIDCLTVWLGNLMHRDPDLAADAPPITAFLETLRDCRADRIIIVTNEVGWGIIPESAMTRRYRDLAGHVNRRIAEAAQRVILMVCGCPAVVKGAE